MEELTHAIMKTTTTPSLTETGRSHPVHQMTVIGPKIGISGVNANKVKCTA